MRFNYPHRLYAFGFIMLVIILIYGIVILYDINQEGSLPVLFLPFYGIISYLFGRFYYKFYTYYRTRYIDVYMQYLEFCTGDLCIHLDEEDILGIYYAKHRQVLKVFRILHIFGRDGTYIYVTNEVNKYNMLILLIKYYYPEQFKVCKSMIKGVQDVNIDLLEAHLRSPHPK